MSGANSALKEEAVPGEGYRWNHPAAAHVVLADREQGWVVGTRKKIAICGFASSSREQIPVDDQEWEVWGLNQLYRHIKRADRWFDIHWNWDQEVVPGTDHRAWARECGIPFYMVQTHEDLPTSVRFPLDRLLHKFGADYFTSTIAYMVALALDEIDQRVSERLQSSDPVPEGVLVMEHVQALYGDYTIGIYGVDLVVGEEYFWQKPCAEFWIGAAAIGRGIKVLLPQQTALCKQPFRYGYETEPPSPIKLSEIKAHGGRLASEREELLKRLYMVDGAMQVDEYWHQLLELRARGAFVG